MTNELRMLESVTRYATYLFLVSDEGINVVVTKGQKRPHIVHIISEQDLSSGLQAIADEYSQARPSTRATSISQKYSGPVLQRRPVSLTGLARRGI